MPLPVVSSDWWTIVRSPDLGSLNGTCQQAMDFGIWRAADQTWQLGACVRNTAAPGEGRLLFRWEAAQLASPDWREAGILMQAEPSFGERSGGLQAPFVIQHHHQYFMFFGGWSNICLATSHDGKTFARRLNNSGGSALFESDRDALIRDPAVIAHAGRHYLYYTHVEDEHGAICVRSSPDLAEWSDATVASEGGSAGNGPTDAECAFVYPFEDSLLLFRWDSRGITTIYRSINPLDFGVNDDRHKIGELPYEVVRIIRDGPDHYLASLHDDCSGIRLARMRWQ